MWVIFPFIDFEGMIMRMVELFPFVLDLPLKINKENNEKVNKVFAILQAYVILLFSSLCALIICVEW